MARSVDSPVLWHLAPIPVASRHGPLLASSVIAPYEPGTRDCPSQPDRQADNIFYHIGEVLAAEGGEWTDIVKMTFFAVDLAAAKPHVDRNWLLRFPDEDFRPARHTLLVPPYGGDMILCADFLAYIYR